MRDLMPRATRAASLACRRAVFEDRQYGDRRRRTDREVAVRWLS